MYGKCMPNHKRLIFLLLLRKSLRRRQHRPQNWDPKANNKVVRGWIGAYFGLIDMFWQTNMNDDYKIRALMIYYDHWGKEQVRLENKIRDFVATMDKIKNVFYEEENEHDFSFLTEVHFLGMHLQYGFISPANCVNKIANELLEGMGGTVQPPPIHSPAWKLAKNLRKSVFDILQNVIDTDQMRAIDAIVAF